MPKIQCASIFSRGIHLAKRFYDMAAETNADAYLPVSIVLFKLHLEFLWEKFCSIFSSSPLPTTTTTTEERSTIDFDSSWDLYLMAALLGLIGALYIMRRQRVALQQQQQPVRAPVQ